MRPASNSASPPQAPAKANPTPSEDDVMMMGFEFFNEKGQLSPRKILFTEKTCPNKTQRVLSNLFGTIMKWNACRWAENFLKTVPINKIDANDEINARVTSLLRDIRKDGFVSWSKLFSLVASGTTETKLSIDDDDQNSGIRTGDRFTGTSIPFLINHDEVAQKFKAQSSSSNQAEIGSTKVDSKDTKPDESELFGACQIIEDYWSLFSKTNGGEGAPDQYKLPVKSGFLDYCRGSSTRKKGEQAVEQLTSNTLFIEMTEKQWSLYGRVMPAPQYAAWTKKRDEWIALSRKSIQARAEDQTPKRDPRLELKTEKPTAPTDTARTIVQEFLAIRAELMETSHGNAYLPPPVQAIFDSGFITYCDRGISAFPNIDLAKLEEFINQDESKFKVFSKILSPENFSKLKEKRDEIAQKIAQLRATPPAPSNLSEDDSEREIPLSGVDVSGIYSSTNNVTGLFAEFPIITLEQLKQIEWDAADLHLKISLADAKKMRAYFSTADISEEQFDICKKLGQISRRMHQSYISYPRPFDEENTSDTKDPAHLLGRIYSEYLIRHTKETRDKARASKIKKSAKKIRSDKKSTSKPKKKIEKNIKPKQKSRSETKKPIEPNTLDESHTLNEEARQ